MWISFTNGASSTGSGGSSTVARYTLSGTLLHTWSIAGSVDGLRIDPSGQVWAMQNQDANSSLTLIDPVSSATTQFAYGSSYTNSAGRGFDDAQFPNGQVFLSETNPGPGTDPIILRTALSNPLQVTGILNSTFTGTNLATGGQASTTITDPDSLLLSPANDLVLTGEGDQEIVFVHNAGTVGQTESFISLLGISGNPDDTVFATYPTGVFYVADTGANTVYALRATGLTPGSMFVDAGNELGSLDTTTGIVTPLFTGTSPHGVAFLTPEPASLYLVVGAVLFAIGWFRRNQHQSRSRSQSRPQQTADPTQPAAAATK